MLVIATEELSRSQLVALAVDRVWYPLVRLLMRYQVGFPFVSQRLKAIYLDLALRQGGSDSRINLLTGIHRKDVRRFREDSAQFEPGERKGLSLAAQVVATWMNTPPYCDEHGEPRLLFRLRTQGEPNFEDLVDSVARQDVRARVIFDELVGNQTVSEDSQGRVYLNAQAFIPGEDFAARADFFALGVSRHVESAMHNLHGEKPAWLERGVYANNLTSAQIAELHAHAGRQAQLLLRELNQMAKQMQKQNAGVPEDLHRFHFGVFFYAENQGSIPPDDDAAN